MPIETIHFRVEYSNGAVYHIVASTNVDEMPNWNQYFPNQPYVPTNGLASLFMKSSEAAGLQQKNIYMPNGNAQNAAMQMVNQLNLLNNAAQPLYLMEY